MLPANWARLERRVRLRAAHLALLGLALVPAYPGIDVIARGSFDRSYDNTLWNHLGLGGLLLVVASALRDLAATSPGAERFCVV